MTVAFLLVSAITAGTPLSGAGRAIDGDSLRVGGYEVRLFGIDAPEAKQTCSRDGQPWACGLASADQLATLVDGRQVNCIAVGLDRYQRVVARCSVGSRELNRYMVATGYAVAYRRYALDYVSAEESAKATPGGAAATARESTRFAVQLERFVLERGTVVSVAGRLELSGDRIAAADLGTGAGRGSTFRVTPAGQARNLNVYVADFGQLMKETGWLDGLVGGDLDLRGRFDDTQGLAPFAGRLRIGPYHFEKVTPRAGVGTLNSTIDALRRAGDPLQQFDSLEASVAKVADRIELKDGHTSGKSIGLTTAGTIDLARDQASLRGIVVPGFALNNVLSNVPLLGPLLTGGKDGGVFAIAYRLEGPLDDLKTDVNMMSAMTPGALREIFTGSGGAPQTRSETPSDHAP